MRSQKKKQKESDKKLFDNPKTEQRVKFKKSFHWEWF